MNDACTMCGVSRDKHGTYPTCATHEFRACCSTTPSEPYRKDCWEAGGCLQQDDLHKALTLLRSLLLARGEVAAPEVVRQTLTDAIAVLQRNITYGVRVDADASNEGGA